MFEHDKNTIMPMFDHQQRSHTGYSELYEDVMTAWTCEW